MGTLKDLQSLLKRTLNEDEWKLVTDKKEAALRSASREGLSQALSKAPALVNNLMKAFNPSGKYTDPAWHVVACALMCHLSV